MWRSDERKPEVDQTQEKRGQRARRGERWGQGVPRSQGRTMVPSRNGGAVVGRTRRDRRTRARLRSIFIVSPHHASGASKLRTGASEASIHIQTRTKTCASCRTPCALCWSRVVARPGPRIDLLNATDPPVHSGDSPGCTAQEYPSVSGRPAVWCGRARPRDAIRSRPYATACAFLEIPFWLSHSSGIHDHCQGLSSGFCSSFVIHLVTCKDASG